MTESRHPALGISIPEAWQSTTVASLCGQYNGALQTGPFGSQLHASDYSADGIPVVMPQDLVRGSISVARIARVSEDNANRLERHKLLPGDVVFSRRGDVTRFAIVTEQEKGWLCGTGCLRIRMGAAPVSPSYLRYFWSHDSIKRWLLSEAQGATMPNLNTKILGALPVLFPPLDEQKRIAAILDKADAIRRKRQEAIALTDELLRSTFLEMFGDPVTNPKGWAEYPLRALCSHVVDCPHSTPTYSPAPTGYFCVRSSDIRNSRMVLSETKQVPEEVFHERIKRLEPTANDIIYCREGGRFGNAALVPPSLHLCMGQRMMLLRAAVHIATPIFLWMAVTSPDFYRRASNLSVGTAAPRVNVRDLVEVSVLTPPLELQQRFESIAETTMALRDRLGRAAEYDENLFHSLIHHAFHGDLLNTAA